MKGMRLLILMCTIGLLSFKSLEPQWGVYTSYIFHFTKYTEWPADMKSGDFVIGILGESGIKPHLESLSKQKKVGTQTIVVKNYTTSSLEKCHMLFIPSDQQKNMSKILGDCKNNNTMVITESTDATKDGAVINFFDSNGKIKFQLSMGNAEAHNLKVSTFLQRLAVVVE